MVRARLRWHLVRLTVLAVATAALGCGDEADDTDVPEPVDGGTTCGDGEILRPDGSCAAVGPDGTGCPPGELELDDGTCQPAGLPPDMACPPGGHLAVGDCQPAGVPIDGCGEGFVHDGVDGCDPVLPAAPCPPGQMALPGETACRAVAPCGSGTYGTIPTDGTTQHVDAAYGGGSSDGSAARPWTTISAAYDAAAANAIVAVAAGSYPESLVVRDKPVRLWGRCPSLVTLAGEDGSGASLFVWTGASGTEIRGVSITGPGYGVAVSDAEQVLLDQVHVHDNEVRGLHVHTSAGPASVTVRNSLFEANVAQGIFARATTVVVEDSVVRDTVAHASGTATSGLAADCDDQGDTATLAVRHGLVERNLTAGILAACVDLSVADTVVRDQVVDTDGQGIGIQVLTGPAAIQSTLTLESSALLDGNNIGLALTGAAATVDDTVIRATGTRADGGGGHGINIRDGDISGLRSELTLRTSLIEDNHAIGVFVCGSDGLVEDTVLRGTRPNPDGWGIGVQLEKRPAAGERPSVTVRRSVVEDSSDIGMYVTGGDLTVEASIVRGTVEGNEYYGGGVYAATAIDDPGRTELMATRSVIEDNTDVGVVAFGADVTISASVVRDSRPTMAGGHGMGVYVGDSTRTEARGALTMRGTLLERNTTFGVVFTGREASLDGLLVRDTRVAPAGTMGCGLSFIATGDPGTPVVGSAKGCRIEQSRDLGLYAYGATVAIEGCSVTDTESNAEGLYGDGICIDSSADHPSHATITDTTITRSARAAILNFGSEVAIARSLLLCQAFDLDGENWDTPFRFEDLGGNGCGCPGPQSPCQVLSATLAPPQTEPPGTEPTEPPGD